MGPVRLSCGVSGQCGFRGDTGKFLLVCSSVRCSIVFCFGQSWGGLFFLTGCIYGSNNRFIAIAPCRRMLRSWPVPSRLQGRSSLAKQFCEVSSALVDKIRFLFPNTTLVQNSIVRLSLEKPFAESFAVSSGSCSRGCTFATSSYSFMAFPAASIRFAFLRGSPRSSS